MAIEYTEWEIYTGRLIVSFGDIELLTYKLFEIWLESKSSKDYTLGKRLDKLIGYVDRLETEDGKKQKIKDLLIEAKKLNRKRNQIAHNPILLRKFDNSNSVYERAIVDLRGKNETLSLEELHEDADAADSLKSELFILVSQLTKRGINELFTT